MPRGPRPIDIDTELSEVLAHLRHRCGVTTRAEVNLDRLQDVEAALAIRFEDDVLALFAAAVPVLGVDLAAVIGMTGDLKAKRVPGDYVGLGELGSDSYVVIDKGRQEAGASVLIVIDKETHETERRSCLEHARATLGDVGGSPTGDVAPYAPVLVRPVPESTAHGKPVRHAVFGEGHLLSENGKGPTRKCKVDFPGHGLKVLQARFLEFL